MNDLQRLTIVVSDGTIFKNAKGYSALDLSDCSIPENVWALQWKEGSGWVEFTDSSENLIITGTQFPEWALKCLSKFEAYDFAVEHPDPLTPEDWAQINVDTAKNLLSDSDWAALPDVNLQNKLEWFEYRERLREIMSSPPLEEIQVWPVKPEAVWGH